MRRLTQFLNWVKDQLKGKLYAEIQRITSEIGAYFDATDANQTTIYDVPSGKRFSLEYLMIYNEEGSATRYVFYDSTNTDTPIMTIDIGATTREEITDLEGIVFDTVVSVDPSQFTTGSQIVVGGILCDQ